MLTAAMQFEPSSSSKAAAVVFDLKADAKCFRPERLAACGSSVGDEGSAEPL
jgi:hypothetical protein